MSNSDLEKTGLDMVDMPVAVVSNTEREPELTPQEQKKIIRRIDLRLVLTLGLLYCTSLMDRINLSSAYIAGSVAESLSELDCLNSN